jgi:hypothetical protein
MGIAFSSIPAVGAVSTWPKPGTFALIQMLYRIATYREWSVPRSRSNPRYVIQDASGSSTGGGGAGTIANPWKVRHMADLRTLYTAQRAADQTWYLRNGDKFYAMAANSDQGLVIVHSNVSFLGYSDPNQPSTEKPVLAGFCPVSGGALVSGNVYDFSIIGTRAYWVRGKLAGTGYTAYRDQPYKRVNSNAAVASTPYSFYDDGSSNTRVNIGSHDLATIQFSYATGAGITAQSTCDSVLTMGLIREGWGMNNMGAAGGGQTMRFEATGTSEQVSIDCEDYWGPYHTCGHLVTGTGGIVSWIRNKWGLFGWQNANGDGDCNVAYASGGGHESLRIGHQCTHAGLEAEGVPASRGWPWYGHGNAGQAPALVVVLDFNDVPVWGSFGGFNVHGECPDIADTAARRSIASYRTFLHNGRFSGKQGGTSSDGGFSPNNIKAIVSNFDATLECPTPGGIFGSPFAAGAQNLKGLWFNSTIDLNLTGAWSGAGNKRLNHFYSTSGGHNFDFVHCAMIQRGASPTALNMNPGAFLQSCGTWNTVHINATATGEMNLTGGTADHFRNADPASAIGGLSAPALFGIPSGQYSSLPSRILLASGTAWSSGPTAPANTINATRTLPTELECEYDRNMQRRNPDHTKRTIGPYEARPIISAGGGTFVGVCVSPTLIGG